MKITSFRARMERTYTVVDGRLSMETKCALKKEDLTKRSTDEDVLIMVMEQ